MVLKQNMLFTLKFYKINISILLFKFVLHALITTQGIITFRNCYVIFKNIKKIFKTEQSNPYNDFKLQQNVPKRTETE